MRDDSEDRDEDDNLVPFPQSENDLYLQERGIDYSDPLESLLNEFAHLEDDFEDEGEESEALESFEDCKDEVCTLELLQKKLDSIDDIMKRMKYYIDDIDMFTSKRRN